MATAPMNKLLSAMNLGLRLQPNEFWLAVALSAALLATAGCETVDPWERGRLAHDCMQIPVDAGEAAYRSHLEVVRSGSVGGTTSGGGGCGCN
ncbi:MAG: DUF4266 domain-containing protein [Bradymonadaceae bacterium]